MTRSRSHQTWQQRIPVNEGQLLEPCHERLADASNPVTLTSRVAPNADGVFGSRRPVADAVRVSTMHPQSFPDSGSRERLYAVVAIPLVFLRQ